MTDKLTIIFLDDDVSRCDMFKKNAIGHYLHIAYDADKEMVLQLKEVGLLAYKKPFAWTKSV